MTTSDEVVRSDVRRPVNAYLRADHSIHNDDVAKPLGLRGGTIAGSVHMDQFPPVLVEAFGPAWFETGSLSLRFENPTTDREPVVVSVRRPQRRSDVQVEARVEREDGLIVASGTAAVGDPGVATHLHSVDLRPSPRDEVRMFAGLAAGKTIVRHPGRMSSSDAAEREAAGHITEPLPWYTGESPWGGPVASPSSVVRLLYRPTSEAVSTTTGGAVGLFGAIEVRHLAGPVRADVDYTVESRLVAAGASPRTEYVWFDSTATDTEGRAVASMRMQLRYMKASSSLFEGEG